MTKKLETIKLSGKTYATVPTRIKEFREMCPNGLIETTPSVQEDGSLIFKTRILKDKSNPDSGEGTGHSRGFTKNSKGEEDPKAFEKLETISVGRALAILGFMASGDVASFEEMEEFMSEKETQKQALLQKIKKEVDVIVDIEVLRKYYIEHKGNGAEVDAYIMDKANELKAKK